RTEMTCGRKVPRSPKAPPNSRRLKRNADTPLDPPRPGQPHRRNLGARAAASSARLHRSFWRRPPSPIRARLCFFLGTRRILPEAQEPATLIRGGSPAGSSEAAGNLLQDAVLSELYLVIGQQLDDPVPLQLGEG